MIGGISERIRPKRFKLIACEILFREASYCAALSRNIIDPVFLPKGLHDLGAEKMSRRLAEEVERTEADRYDAILLGYGLCNNGILGVKAGVRLVVPRTHDCIAILLGSRGKYDDFFANSPGTYFKSTGWTERDAPSAESSESVTSQLGLNPDYRKFVEKYGEENAAYLMETMGDWLKNYTKFAYIDTGFGDFSAYKAEAAEEAKNRSLAYEELTGSIEFLMRLMDGDWDPESFLVLEPGQKIAPAYDGSIVTIGYP
jgi:hypothetical protein